jgi:hypothetical protein
MLPLLSMGEWCDEPRLDSIMHDMSSSAFQASDEYEESISRAACLAVVVWEHSRPRA